jgi:hypothetical protein
MGWDVMSDYRLELLHPGHLRRAYRTGCGLYATLERAQASVPINGAGWRRRDLVVGKYQYVRWVCEPFGKSGNHAWWQVMEAGGDTP